MISKAHENLRISGLRMGICRTASWFGATLLFMLLAPVARGAEDAPKKSQFESIGSFGEGVGAFTAQGHILYTAGGCTVRAMDIRNPQQPKVLGWVRMQEPINSLEIRGPALYVGMSHGGCAWLVDASDPAHLRRVKEIGGWNQWTEIRLMGDFLYIQSSGKVGGAHSGVLCITDPLKPVIVYEGSFHGYTTYYAFITNGKRLYAMHKAHEDNDAITLAVEDCTKRPAKKILTRKYDLSEAPGRLDLDIKTGQVWLGGPELKGRALVGQLDLTTDAWCISNEDRPKDWRYQFSGPWILSPYGNDDTGEEGYNLFHRARMEEPVLKFRKEPMRIIGNYLYVDDDHYYKAYPLQDLAHLKEQPFQTEASFYDLRIPDPQTVLSDTRDGLKIFDMSNPLHWVERGTLQTQIDIDSFKVVDRVAYAVGGQRLSIVDCHKPELPVQLGGCDLPGKVNTCAVENDNVYAGGAEGKVYAIDVRKPAQPVLRGTGALPEEPQAMAASGNRLFVADGDAGLQVIDTSDPAKMKTIGGYPTPEPCVDLATSGTLVYALTPETLCVLDASGSSTPTLKGTLDYRANKKDEEEDGNAAFSIKRLGNALYLIRSHGGQNMTTDVDIVDVSNPAAPRMTNGRIQNISGEDPPANTKKSPAGTAPKSKTAGWVLGIPSSIHTTDGTDHAMDYYDLADPLNPVFVDRLYSSECSQSILYKDILYKPDGGSVMILHRVGKENKSNHDR